MRQMRNEDMGIWQGVVGYILLNFVIWAAVIGIIWLIVKVAVKHLTY